VSPSVPAIILWLLPPLSWIATVILVRAARKPPRIGALTERAVLALVFAIAVTVYAYVVTLNVELGRPFLDVTATRFVVRALFIAIGLAPLWWLWAYWRGRLG
jgi:hypothetical protein